MVWLFLFFTFLIFCLSVIPNKRRRGHLVHTPEQMRMIHDPIVGKVISNAKNAKEPVEFIFEGKKYIIKNIDIKRR